jgi:dephospho-CoA kinase
VALTGNVAAGKSAVAAAWIEAGVPVVSADELSRAVVAPGSAGLEEVRQVFGDDVIGSDGSLDRAALRSRVFKDAEARSRLEAIIHPRVWSRRAQWLREQQEAGEPVVVAEIPLLFETGREKDFDLVVLVDAPTAERRRRLVELRGIEAQEAAAILASQMDAAEKRKRADLVIDNDGSVEELARKAEEVLATIRSRADGGTLRLDLHLHTAGSWDCLSDPHAVLERARSRGLDRIAITDHNRLGVALRMAEQFPRHVIPGEEVKTAEGIDVIGLYLSREIAKGTPAVETVEQIREQGGIPYLPHPYAGGKGGGGKYAEELAPLMDVVEVFNARLHPGRLNAPARDLANRHKRLAGAGSDAHTLREIGGVWVQVPGHANDADGLRRALETGTVTGRTASNLVHLASTWAKVRKRLPGGVKPSDGIATSGGVH